MATKAASCGNLLMLAPAPDPVQGRQRPGSKVVIPFPLRPGGEGKQQEHPADCPPPRPEPPREPQDRGHEQEEQRDSETQPPRQSRPPLDHVSPSESGRILRLGTTSPQVAE